MSDSGKHSALRQTGDGSFELVFEDGLEEISEDAPADVEATVDTPRPAQSGTSRRILAIGALAAVLLVVLAVGVWMASPGGSGGAGDGGEGERGAPGFKPYAGEGEPTSASRTPPSSADDSAEQALPEDDLDEVSAEAEEVIEEDEAGWELAEEDVIVEEGEEGEELLDEESSEVDAGDDEGVAEEEELEEEEFEEEEFEEEEPDDLDARREQLRPEAPTLGRPIRPRIPNIGQNGVRSLPDLPVRRINPETGTLDDVEPLDEPAYDDEEPYDEEPYDEEAYDEEPYDEY